MTIKRFLIIAPALVSLVLLISYFWVPTYEEQTRGNPQRLEQFITASIGDATVLKPDSVGQLGQQPDRGASVRRAHRSG
jgi:hypothetical protein